ncbi:hypothetical protein KKC22_09530 [Myxococcota bacterium]|nr:hypothetical protein [Myxococcota bacterium]
MLNARLVEKGKQYDVDALQQQGIVTHGNALEHLPELMTRGLPEARVTHLKEQLDRLATARGDRGVTRDGAKALTQEEGLAKSEGKTLSRAVREALRIVLKDGPVDGVSLDQFALHGNQLQTTPEVLAHLSALAPKLAPLDAELARFFEGQKASELVNAAWAWLRDADALQEKTRADLPAETLALLELKGSVLDLIEEINGIARIAFDGRAEIRGKFNKDLLYRRRRAGKDAPAAPAV